MSGDYHMTSQREGVGIAADPVLDATLLFSEART